MSAAKGNMSAAGSRAGSNVGSARARSTAGTEQAASSLGKSGSRAGYFPPICCVTCSMCAF
jgi:hypothetical protein